LQKALQLGNCRKITKCITVYEVGPFGPAFLFVACGIDYKIVSFARNDRFDSTMRYGFDRPRGRFCKSGEPSPDPSSTGGLKQAEPVSQM
jgi:hypothetical protein